MINTELHDLIREKHFETEPKLTNQLLIEADSGKDEVIEFALNLLEILLRDYKSIRDTTLLSDY